MKKKVGTAIEGDTLRRLKQRAAHEQRPMSEIIEEALARYFAEGPRDQSLRKAVVDRLCSRPFRLTPSQLRHISSEDYYDQ